MLTRPGKTKNILFSPWCKFLYLKNYWVFTALFYLWKLTIIFSVQSYFYQFLLVYWLCYYCPIDPSRVLSRFADASSLITEVLPEGGSVSEKELGDIFVQMYPAVRPDYVRESLKCMLENLAIVSVQVLSTQYVPIYIIYIYIIASRVCN